MIRVVQVGYIHGVKTVVEITLGKESYGNRPGFLHRILRDVVREYTSGVERNHILFFYRHALNLIFPRNGLSLFGTLPYLV